MRYLILESHLGYAIALDKSGRFLKVVNLGYEIGQMTEHVIIFDTAPRKQISHSFKKQLTMIAAVACFCLVLLGAYQNLLKIHGNIRMQINPDIVISVNKLNYVIGLDALNEDGKALIENYKYFSKTLHQVSDDLTDRAFEQDFLSENGRIILDISSSDSAWVSATEEKLIIHLSERMEHKVEVMTKETYEDSRKTKQSQSYTIITEDEEKIEPAINPNENHSPYDIPKNTTDSNSDYDSDHTSDYDSDYTSDFSSDYDLDDN